MHENHRQRMKDRFLSYGGENFADHELLEMLLFFAQPRKNTNPCAHALMERFGSVKAILEASVDELTEVPEVGQHTAILIHLIPELLRRAALDGEKRGTVYDSVGKIGGYIYPYFLGLDHERLYMMIFNNRMEMMDCILISEGVVNASEASIRKMVELCLRKKAANVVIAHNHPNGVAYPSDSDVSVTTTLYEALHSLDIHLVEHLVIAGNRFWPIVKQNCQIYGTNVNVRSMEIDCDRFYDCEQDKEGFVLPKNKTQLWLG